MMNLTEKISYIKGLCKGLSLDETKPEVQVINAIVDMLDDIAYEVSGLSEDTEELSCALEEIDEELEDMYDALGGCECCDDDCDCCEDDEDNPYYEITCQHCGEKFSASEDELLFGEVLCPHCGKVNHYDFSDLFDAEESSCCDCDDCKEN